VALIGESEMENGVVLLKNMQSGEQQEMNIEDFFEINWL
jgi:histidyl-tRNA synthetase